MTASIHSLAPTTPEILAPSLCQPVRGPINGADQRLDFAALQDDMKLAWDFATAKGLSVLTVAADRNGAYLVVAPHPSIYALFGDECGQHRRHVDHGLTTEHWLGCIGHIRVFWREVKCAA